MHWRFWIKILVNLSAKKMWRRVSSIPLCCYSPALNSENAIKINILVCRSLLMRVRFLACYWLFCRALFESFNLSSCSLPWINGLGARYTSSCLACLLHSSQIANFTRQGLLKVWIELSIWKPEGGPHQPSVSSWILLHGPRYEGIHSIHTRFKYRVGGRWHFVFDSHSIK